MIPKGHPALLSPASRSSSSSAGDGGVFRSLPDVGGRVREAAGAPAGHCEEEEGGESEDGVASQSGPP